MASNEWIPGAVHDLVNNRSRRTNDPVRYIIHMAVTHSDDIYGPGKGYGGTYAHLYNPKHKTLRQHQLIGDKAYASLDANGTSVSCEHEGWPGDDMTDGQVERNAQVFAFLVNEWNVPNRIATVDDTRGLAGHRLGISGNFGAYDSDDITTWTGDQSGENWSGAFGKTCFPTDSTDVLTDQGWTPVSKVTAQDQVASVNLAGGVRFGSPVSIIEPFMSDVVRVGAFESTPDHDWVVRRSGPSTCLDCDFTGERRAVGVHRQHTGHRIERSDQWVKIPAEEVRDRDTPLTVSPRTGGLDLTDSEIRLAGWLFADGHYMTRTEDGPFTGIEWHLRKDRKVQAIIELLGDFNVPYRKITQSDGTTKIRVYGDDARTLRGILPNKRFDQTWLGLSAHQCDVLWSVLCQADGASTISERKEVCFSTDQESLEMIQAATLLNGREATMWHSSGLWWLLRRKRNTRLSSAVPSRHTEVSCVETQDGTLLVRQNGRVVVSGNCPTDAYLRRFAEIFALAQDYIDGDKKIDVDADTGGAPAGGTVKPTPEPERDPKAGDKHEWWWHALRVDGDFGLITKRALQRLLHPESVANYDGLIDGVMGNWTVECLQEWLRDLGYYSGYIDGEWGELTTKALQAKLYDDGFYYNNGYSKSVMVDGDFAGRTVEGLQRYLNDQRKYYND